MKTPILIVLVEEDEKHLTICIAVWNRYPLVESEISLSHVQITQWLAELFQCIFIENE